MASKKYVCVCVWTHDMAREEELSIGQAITYLEVLKEYAHKRNDATMSTHPYCFLPNVL